MTDERWEVLEAGWRRLVALVYAFAVSRRRHVPRRSLNGRNGRWRPGATDGGGRGGGLAWVVVLIAVAVAISIFTRRRTGPYQRRR